MQVAYFSLAVRAIRMLQELMQRRHCAAPSVLWCSGRLFLWSIVLCFKGTRCEKAGTWCAAFRCRCAENRVAARVSCAAKDAKWRNIVHPLPLPLRGALDWCKGVVRCKKAKCFFHSIEQNVFQPRTHRAHCAATAEKEAQRSNLAAVHPCIPEQSTHSRKICTIPHISQAPHQREARSKERAE